MKRPAESESPHLRDLPRARIQLPFDLRCLAHGALAHVAQIQAEDAPQAS